MDITDLEESTLGTKKQYVDFCTPDDTLAGMKCTLVSYRTFKNVAMRVKYGKIMNLNLISSGLESNVRSVSLNGSQNPST